MSLTFWKPGTTGPGSSLDRDTQVDGNVLSSAPSSAMVSTSRQREQLPIAKHRQGLLFAVENHGVVIVVGQTGCGKTTQLPQYLYEAGWADNGHVIACTQPRRVAATSVANRVASEVGSQLGDEVGYTIRFEDLSDRNKTRILYMTDGMLFRETLIDPLLSRYSVVMVDEAHERSIYTDLLLGVLKKIRSRRPSLRIIVSSATLDASRLRDYFAADASPDDVTIVSLEGRMYPVEVAYLREPAADYVEKAAQVAWDINLQQGLGDILIFLPGRVEIDTCVSRLQEMFPTLPPRASKIVALPLYAGLTMEEQMSVFSSVPSGERKVVVSTNIAEASVTIDGIKFVIDSGYVKIRTYNPTLGLATLSTVPISAASAVQRAGRAGRTSAGFCYRLYTAQQYQSLPASATPEITRLDMSLPILQLKALGINDVMKFGWVSAPPAESVIRGLEVLHSAGMMDEHGRLTPTGQNVSEFPVDIKIAQLLFNSKEYGCGEEALSIAAITSVQNVFLVSDNSADAVAELERRKFTAEEGDHFTLLNAFNGFVKYGKTAKWCKAHSLSFRALSRALAIRNQLKKYMERFHLPISSCQGDIVRLSKCLASAYKHNIARWTADGTYRSVQNNQIFSVHPLSVLFTRKPKTGWVLFGELEETKQIQINILTQIEPDWLVNQGFAFK